MDKQTIIKSYKKIIDKSQHYIGLSIESNNFQKTQAYRLSAISELESLLNVVDITDYLLLDHKSLVPKVVYIESYFNLGTLYKTCAESLIQSKINDLRKNALNRSQTALEIGDTEKNGLIKP
jgi:hypothetical protein